MLRGCKGRTGWAINHAPGSLPWCGPPGRLWLGGTIAYVFFWLSARSAACCHPHPAAEGALPGDVRYELLPGRTGDIGVGASHAYDTHVPLLWFGPGIPAGVSYAPPTITNIAPTAVMLLNSKLSSACTGQPIVELLSPFKEKK
jgi:hypothetical protein